MRGLHVVAALLVKLAGARALCHGLDLRQFPFDRSRSPDAAPPVILSVGRLIENKGLRARWYRRVVSPVSDVALPDTKGTLG